MKIVVPIDREGLKLNLMTRGTERVYRSDSIITRKSARWHIGEGSWMDALGRWMNERNGIKGGFRIVRRS